MTAAALLNDLAEALGYDLCKQFVTPEMESLSEVSTSTAVMVRVIAPII